MVVGCGKQMTALRQLRNLQVSARSCIKKQFEISPPIPFIDTDADKYQWSATEAKKDYAEFELPVLAGVPALGSNKQTKNYKVFSEGSVEELICHWLLAEDLAKKLRPSLEIKRVQSLKGKEKNLKSFREAVEATRVTLVNGSDEERFNRRS